MYPGFPKMISGGSVWFDRFHVRAWLRYAPGESPFKTVNCLLKCAVSKKPHWAAISLTVLPEFNSRALALENLIS